MSEKNDKRSFEEMLSRLDAIVNTLEKGDTELESSLALYTEGAELIRLCTEKLNSAEQIVTKLQKDAQGEPAETPFTPEND